MSQRTNKLLTLSLNASEGEIRGFVDKVKHFNVHEQTAITCVCSIAKSIDEEASQENLLVGTENGKLHVVDPVQNFKIVHTIDLPAAPVQLSATGSISVEYKVRWIVLTFGGRCE